MSLIDLSALPQLGRLIEQVSRAAAALERLAVCMEKQTEIPAAPPIPEKRIGPEAIGSYAQAIMDAEDADDFREQLHKAGLSDAAIEEQLVKALFGEGTEESTS